MDANEQQFEIVPLAERVEEGITAAYTQHGYVIGDELDKQAVEDRVYALAAAAVVEKRADRGKTAITRRGLMSATFRQVPGPEAWAEQEDPELAAGIYSRLAGHLWRLVSSEADGKIQQRLNGDLGLTLCHTKATPDKTEAVYVTKDLQCLLADFTAPQKTRIQKEADRFAKNLAMVVSRQPEYAKRLGQELTGGMKAALGTSQAILAPAIESAKASDGETEDSHGDE
jgi:hypothetical protein